MTIETPDARCADCRFWIEGERRNVPVIEGGIVKSVAAGIIGECRRNGPTGSRAWPKTLDTDWCGEFSGKEQPQPRSTGSGQEGTETTKRKPRARKRTKKAQGNQGELLSE